MKKKITAYCGVIASGKDHQCNLLEAQGYKRIAFADSLRELTWKIFDWTPKNEDDYIGFKVSEFREDGFPILTGRQFLQRLGTDARKIIGDDIWLKALKRKLESSQETKFCISDLRFQNEFDFIKSLDGKYDVEIIFTNYKSNRYNAKDKHESEYLAQNFLKAGKKHMDILYKTAKIGDPIRVNKNTGVNSLYVGSLGEITDINKNLAYPYEIELHNVTLNMVRSEFEVIEPL